MPNTSRFLLKIYFFGYSIFHIETQKYWALAVNAALTAKTLELAREARAKCVKRRANAKRPSRKKFGIMAIEQQIQNDGMHRTKSQPDKIQDPHLSHPSLNCFVLRCPHLASIISNLRSNRRL
jgi:hypothetical protein